jgi:8-oxo-dGTP pyrophosphatase MutT (NUDIX family)
MERKRPRSSRAQRSVVYKNPYQCVYKVSGIFGGFFKEIFVTDYGQRAGVIVEGPKGILLTRQFRHLIDRVSWEIPGGKVNPGENIKNAALRECLEETGIRCNGLASLLVFQPGLDTLHNPTYLFHTRRFQSTPVRKPIDNSEVSGIEWVSLGKCLSMISSGVIVDSLSIIGLLSYQLFIKKK